MSQSQPSPTFEEWCDCACPDGFDAPYERDEMQRAWDASAARFSGVVEERDRLKARIAAMQNQASAIQQELNEHRGSLELHEEGRELIAVLRARDEIACGILADVMPLINVGPQNPIWERLTAFLDRQAIDP